MALKLVYATTNDIGVKATYTVGATGLNLAAPAKAEWGVCAAMSALWLKKMFENSTRVLLSKPDKHAASFAYARAANRQDGKGLNADQFNEMILETFDLDVQELMHMSGRRVILQVQTVYGGYYFSTGNHAMGFFTGLGGRHYFFDPNIGLLETASPGDLDIAAWIETNYGGAAYDPTWLLARVSKS
jgi:hypothetical protein